MTFTDVGMATDWCTHRNHTDVGHGIQEVFNRKREVTKDVSSSKEGLYSVYMYRQHHRFCEQHLRNFFLMNTFIGRIAVQSIRSVIGSIPIDTMLNLNGDFDE